jgi:hypothetical protein
LPQQSRFVKKNVAGDIFLHRAETSPPGYPATISIKDLILSSQNDSVLHRVRQIRNSEGGCDVDQLVRRRQPVGRLNARAKGRDESIVLSVALATAMSEDLRFCRHH